MWGLAETHSASGCERAPSFPLDENLEARPAQLRAESVVRKRREGLSPTRGLLSPFLMDANCTPVGVQKQEFLPRCSLSSCVWPRVGVCHALQTSCRRPSRTCGDDTRLARGVHAAGNMRPRPSVPACGFEDTEPCRLSALSSPATTWSLGLC